MRYLLAALLGMVLGISMCKHAKAGGSWDTGDKALGLAALTFTAVDWRQTYLVAKHPERWTETNNAIGAHPTTGRVNGYFVGSILLGAVVADILPPAYRKGFLAGVTALEFNMVARGYILGMRLGF